MKLKNILITLFATLFISAQANAQSLMVEPYLGYIVSGGGDNGANTVSDIDYTGLNFGGRVGLNFIGLWVAGDFNMSPGVDIERTNTAGATAVVTTEENDFQNLGVSVGYNFPVMFRGWATYYFSSSLEDNDGAGAGTTLKGSGFGFGLGWTGLPFVSLNLEYRALSYDEFEDQPAALGPTSGTLANSRDHSQILFSVSLPLTL